MRARKKKERRKGRKEEESSELSARAANWALVVLFPLPRHRACKRRSHKSVRCRFRVVFLFPTTCREGGIADGASKRTKIERWAREWVRMRRR